MKAIYLNNTSISDYSLHQISSLGYLEQLGVNECKLISDDGIEFISRGCPRLRFLHAQTCDGVKGSGFWNFFHSRKNVRVYCSYSEEEIVQIKLEGSQMDQE